MHGGEKKIIRQHEHVLMHIFVQRYGTALLCCCTLKLCDFFHLSSCFTAVWIFGLFCFLVVPQLGVMISQACFNVERAVKL